jgi:subtilisin family serine protease
MKKNRIGLVAAILLLSTVGTAHAQRVFPAVGQERTREAYAWARKAVGSYQPYQDVRFADVDGEVELDAQALANLTFNRLTSWSMATSILAEGILAAHAYPGLGIGNLHARGIRGAGVSVAIIDQNLAGEHPEFRGKIRNYVDLGCDQAADKGSMHGPAVASLLVGENVGTAPEAKLYYFAVPSWKKDAKYYAEALDLIIEANRGLPPQERIRVVSVSAAPSGDGSPFELNTKSWDEAVRRAQRAGLLVLDCTTTYGFISPGYAAFEDPDNLAAFRSGWPGGPSAPTPRGKLCAPTSFRTIAEEYLRGEYSYQYTCRGGLSWAIPYVAGACALAWQVNPNLSAAEMKALLLKSAYTTAGKARVIDPVALVELAIQAMGRK